MKKLSLMIVALLLSAIVFAQPKSVTKFLGIPIDGSKAEMIQKLKEKGYTYNSKFDCLEGEFNGQAISKYDSILYVNSSKRMENIGRRQTILCRRKRIFLMK